MRSLLIILALTLASYAQNAFIQPMELNKMLDDNKVVILDVGSKDDYADEHIPGAYSTAISQWRHKHHSYYLMNPTKELEALMQGFGIDNDSKVVLYGHNKGYGRLIASYIALSMARVGFKDVTILDGGIEAWDSHDLPLTHTVTQPKKGDFTVKPNNDILVDMAYVKAHLNKVPMIEARPPAFYFGTAHSANVKRNGHIQGAVSNNWLNSFEEDYRLSDKKKLDEIFYDGLGLDADEEVILYCTGGLEASMNWYVLDRVMGFKNLKVYDASLLEWGNREDTPMVRYKWEVFKR